MKSRKYGGDGMAARALAALIGDDFVLGQLCSQWEDFFGDAEGNLLAEWCRDHYRQYGEAPGESILHRFQLWSEGVAEDRARAVEQRIHAANEESLENISSQVLLDQTAAYFTRVSLRSRLEQVQSELEHGRTAEAVAKWEGWSPLRVGASAIIDPATDVAAWRRAFAEDDQRALIRHRGALGNFFGSAFSRDSFVSFMGATSQGKSWWLLDLAYLAVRQRNRVAFFELGDLTEAQVMRRFGQRVLRRPLKNKTVSWPKEIDGEGVIQAEQRKLEKVSDVEAMRAFHRVGFERKDRLRLRCYENSACQVSDLEAEVSGWERQGWVPDVIIADYADIFAPPAGVKEERAGINENWKHLRRLSQRWHCCVITATQADAKAYDAALLRRRNFTDDRRKRDHLTAEFGINSTEAERVQGVHRINSMKLRDGRYSEMRQVYVASCLDCGCPAICSARARRQEASEAS